MVPTSQLQLDIATLLAHDVASLASVTAMHLHLAKAPFVPSPTLAIGSLTEATFDGYTALDLGTGNQLVFQDPSTTLYTVELKPPATGWHFQCTGTTDLPQTIYGFYVTDNADAVLYGSALLANPVSLTASGQGFDVQVPQFAFLNQSPQ